MILLRQGVGKFPKNIPAQQKLMENKIVYAQGSWKFEQVLSTIRVLSLTL